jgi:hypothetical protein
VRGGEGGIAAAQGEVGGLEIQEAEIYAHPTQFVSRVMVSSACAPLASQGSVSSSSLDTGSILHMREVSREHILKEHILR